MRKFFVVAMMAVASMAHAQMMPPIPADPAYRVGKLDNGLTYYIRHNAYPEHTANFYIAQRVGSIQEEDDQRGLAHFLEHMAFNGSTHFKDNSLIEYTRSLGVAFGNDLNAYTSIEQTVYNIDNVPTTRQTALDSCLLILQDWSNGLELKSEEIDKERGVIHGEWAMRNSANQRLFERNLPAMYPNCKYGERMPIGTMEVVDNFKPEALRAYYRKWYHPENQAIIVIGDIDVDHTEAKIKEFFSGIKPGPDAAHVTSVAVPDNNEAIYIFDKDKEMQFSIFELMMKSEAMPREMKGTMALYMQDYITSIITMMFNSRMSELSQQPDCPFVQMNLGYGNYLLSSSADATDASVVAKEGQEKEAFASLIRELKRAQDFGFNASEYVRAKDEYLSRCEKAYSNRDKRKHTQLYQQCVNNFLQGDAMPDPDTEFQVEQMLAQQLPLEMINQTVAQMITINNDTNLVCMQFAQEKDGKSYLDADAMKAVVEAGRAEQLTAWIDNTKDEPLIAQMPKAGTIKKETENKVLGYKELTLSNGAKVILKKTDFKDDEVLLSGFANGGNSLYGPADYNNLKVADDIFNACGLGNFTNNELEKALAGKQAGISLNFGNRYANVSGHSTPKDMETMMQLLYLHFTALKKDEKAVNTLMQQYETMLKNRDLKPETALSDSISARLNNYNKRFANIVLDDLKDVNPDRIMEMAKENFSSANNFTFIIVGNFDEENTRQFVCQYIASLPGKGKALKTKDVRTFFTGEQTCEFKRKMETPKPYIVQAYTAPVENTMLNDVLHDYTTEVLSMMLLKTVREDYGAAYSVGAGGNISTYPNNSIAVMQTYAPISVPEKLDSALLLMNQGVEELCVKADPEMVAKVKANFLKNADVNAKNNGYWRNIIYTYKIDGIDHFTEYKKTVESVTPEMISEYLKKLVASKNKLNVVMRPE